jgi:NRPS condensation-like uncharacterized protein
MTWMFRAAVTLKEQINKSLLEEALEITIKRFPYFRVNMKTGLFWHFWNTNLGKPRVIGDSKYPCERMPINKKGIFPFRVRVFHNRISVEFHHAITDGAGGICFLRSLVAQYFTLKGAYIPDWEDILKPGQKPDPEEFEDASKKYFIPTIPKLPDQVKAFQLPHKLAPKGTMYVTTGILSLSKLLKLSKNYNVSLTVFIAAVLIDSFQKILFSFQGKKQKKYLYPIRIVIPVNARKLYPSKTMRNFFYTVTPGIDPRLGVYSFEEIIKEVYHYMKVEVSDKKVSRQIKRNVHYEIHPVIRIIPVFLKRLLLKLLYPFLGENRTTCALTNVGRVTMPGPSKNEIERFEFLAAPTKINKMTCAVISFEDYIYITFTRIINEPVVEKIFFRKLVTMGLHVKIESNY